jgi:hypothetical protein
MNLPWTTSEFGRAAESAHENFFASISWDAMTCWFASGGLRDSPCGPGSCAVLRSELQVSRTRDREEFARIYPCPNCSSPDSGEGPLFARFRQTEGGEENSLCLTLARKRPDLDMKI